MGKWISPRTTSVTNKKERKQQSRFESLFKQTQTQTHTHTQTHTNTHTNSYSSFLCLFFTVFPASLFFLLFPFFLRAVGKRSGRDKRRGTSHHKVRVVGPSCAVLSEANRIRAACYDDREELAEREDVFVGRPSLTKALNVPLPISPRAPASTVRSVAFQLLELMFSTSSW